MVTQNFSWTHVVQCPLIRHWTLNPWCLKSSCLPTRELPPGGLIKYQLEAVRGFGTETHYVCFRLPTGTDDTWTFYNRRTVLQHSSETNVFIDLLWCHKRAHQEILTELFKLRLQLNEIHGIRYHQISCGSTPFHFLVRQANTHPHSDVQT